VTGSKRRYNTPDASERNVVTNRIDFISILFGCDSSYQTVDSDDRTGVVESTTVIFGVYSGYFFGYFWIRPA